MTERLFFKIYHELEDSNGELEARCWWSSMGHLILKKTFSRNFPTFYYFNSSKITWWFRKKLFLKAWTKLRESGCGLRWGQWMLVAMPYTLPNEKFRHFGVSSFLIQNTEKVARPFVKYFPKINEGIKLSRIVGRKNYAYVQIGSVCKQLAGTSN